MDMGIMKFYKKKKVSAATAVLLTAMVCANGAMTATPQVYI